MKRLAPPVVKRLPTGSLVSTNFESMKARGSNRAIASTICVSRMTGASAAMRTCGEYVSTPKTEACRSMASRCARWIKRQFDLLIPPGSESGDALGDLLRCLTLIRLTVLDHSGRGAERNGNRHRWNLCAQMRCGQRSQQDHDYRQMADSMIHQAFSGGVRR